ncbi:MULTISPECIES: DUF349 domain-containing protein [Salinicola]|uniref:DUF349 domain-containing protein n=1 Tax=Salinicola socius TaxID=404433 RepID=A0A1Q8SXB6_9GAMM|nr:MULTISPECIES: DUF349 domain-containing protein [Salinicola]OLO06088.1 hypothetical protein BTW07_00900 [Salinicola socius]
MPGLFQRFFSPRWRHKDPAVRAQAASQLSPDDLDTLRQLAQDDSPAVRQAALARVQALDPLFQWHRQSPSEESFQRLVDLLGGRVSPSPDLNTRLAKVEQLEDMALVDALIVLSDNQSLRLAALARIDDESRLIHHASENGITAVRHAAAERVVSAEGLALLSKQARRDKQVARLARERLARLRADAEQQSREEGEREQLLETLEAQANRPWEPTFEARLKHWIKRWDALTSSVDESQHARFETAVTRCRQRIAEHDHQHRELERVKREKSEAQATRDGILEALGQALAIVGESERLTPEVMQALQGKWRLQEERWQDVSDRYGVSEPYQQRYVALDQQAQSIWQAWERLQAEAPALRAGLEKGEPLQPALDRLAWPDTLPPTELVLDAQRQATASQRYLDAQGAAKAESQWSQEEIGEHLDALSQELDQGRYRPASQLHRRLRQHLESSGQPLSSTHEQTYKQQSARLAELKDWRGFAAAPKREALLANIEALAEAREQPDAERHRRHQQLIRDWRQLGDAAATRDLAQRFRTASDALHAQLAEWEAELESREQDNLAVRQALCEQLETLLAHPSDAADPDGLRKVRDAAQEQWDQHWPVPRRQAASTGRHYARLRRQLQSLIDERAGDVASRKRDLVEQARQLAEDAAPAGQRAEQAKALQQRWRELGRAPKGIEQTLWRQFRSHCDTIFASRDSVRDEQQAKQQQRFDDMQALIDRLDAWQPESARERHVLDSALAEAQRLVPLPRSRRSEGMEKRWQGIVHAREVTLDRLSLMEEARQWPEYREWMRPETAEAAETTQLDSEIRQALEARHTQRQTQSPEQAEEHLQRCLVQLVLLAGDAIPTALEPLRLEVQVARLNDGLGRPPTPPEELHQTLLRLLSIAPVSGELWERYESAFDNVMAHLGRPGHRHEDDGVDIV